MWYRVGILFVIFLSVIGCAGEDWETDIEYGGKEYFCRSDMWARTTIIQKESHYPGRVYVKVDEGKGLPRSRNLIDNTNYLVTSLVEWNGLSNGDVWDVSFAQKGGIGFWTSECFGTRQESSFSPDEKIAIGIVVGVALRLVIAFFQLHLC